MKVSSFVSLSALLIFAATTLRPAYSDTLEKEFDRALAFGAYHTVAALLPPLTPVDSADLRSPIPEGIVPSIPFSDPRQWEQFRRALIENGIDPSNITMKAIRQALAERIRAMLREKGLPECIIDLILFAWRNGIPIPNLLGNPNIAIYNKSHELLKMLEELAFSYIACMFDPIIEQCVLELDDILTLLRFADSLVPPMGCGNNDGEAAPEELLCFAAWYQETHPESELLELLEDISKKLNELEEAIAALAMTHEDEPLLGGALCVVTLPIY